MSDGEGAAGMEICRVEGGRFFGCYLLTSLCPRYKGHSYIGFTVNPKRRIRQHNGEITSGASTTKRKRPWEMVLCIHGFPTNVAALQFEWAWQHPRVSVAVREAAASFKTLGGLVNKIKLALTMLTLHSWQSMELTVSFLSTKYMKHTAGCPSLPRQMKVHFCSIDELPCYRLHNDSPFGYEDEDEDEDEDDRDSRSSEDDKDSHRQMSMTGIQNESEDIWTKHLRGIDEETPEEEHMHMGHHFPGSTGNGMNKELPLGEEEIWTKHFRGSLPIILEEHPEPFHPSKRGSASTTGKFAKKGDMTFAVTDETTDEQSQPINEQLPNRVAEIIVRPPFSTEEIEVIDLFTPSPNCIITAGSKKKKVARNCPDIIDLTRSPLFVQL